MGTVCEHVRRALFIYVGLGPVLALSRGRRRAVAAAKHLIHVISRSPLGRVKKKKKKMGTAFAEKSSCDCY